jgi:hypothetical protein
MLIVDRLIVGGIKFVLDKVAQAVEEQLNDESVLHQELLEAQLRLEVGDISAKDFAQVESDVLARLREIQARKRGGENAPIALEGRHAQVEASFDADEEH